MTLRRWLLVALSLVSLFMLAMAGVGLTYSVRTGADGERALVSPIPDAAALSTGGAGALLAIGVPGGAFPSSATDVTVERALAYVPAGSTATVNVSAVPMPGGPADLTLDLGALSAGREGFVVKADEASEPRFVETPQVLGEVVSSTTTASLVGLFVASLIGFLAPLLLLVATHRGAGVAGPPAAAGAFCRECRAPLAAGADFCQRCGAWGPGKEA